MAMLPCGEEIFVWELLSSGLLCSLLLPVSRAETHINQPVSPENVAGKMK